MNKLPIFATIAFVAATAVIACSDDETSTPDNGSSGNTGDGGGSDGSSGGDNTSGGDPTTSYKGGSVSLTQIVTEIPGTDPIIFTSASAFFYNATAEQSEPVTSNCTSSKEGDCTILDCDLTKTPEPGPEADGGTAKAPTAGEITISGLQDITLTAAEDTGAYSTDPATGTQRIFQAGGQVKFKAVGADVPAFEKDLAGPADVTLTAPEIPALPTYYELPRDADLTLSWSDGGAGKVEALVSSTTIGQRSVAITCSFDAAAGTGTVPTAAVSKLLPSSGDPTKDSAAIILSPHVTDVVDQDGWKVNLDVRSSGAAKPIHIKE